jgi:hypothetical protein
MTGNRYQGKFMMKRRPITHQQLAAQLIRTRAGFHKPERQADRAGGPRTAAWRDRRRQPHSAPPTWQVQTEAYPGWRFGVTAPPAPRH